MVAVLFFRSPLAPAAADAIRYHNGIPIRHEPADDTLAERVDFTERMLLQKPRS